MTPEAALARFHEYMVGPARFMNLLSCFELGIIDTLRENPGMTAAQLGDVVGAKPDAVEQLLHLLVKEGFVAQDESGGYRLDSLAHVPEADLRRALTLMDLIKVVMLRQVFYLTESVRTSTVVGLKELYDFECDLYGAVAEHKDLRESWATLMDIVTARIDPWFFDNIDTPSGARVLDLAGNTGLGAILTYQLKNSPGLRVTTFDLPEKENECLENFRAHGVAEHCSFNGGDVFENVPKGFDVVLIKHFLDMFNKSEVFKILDGVTGRWMSVGRSTSWYRCTPRTSRTPTITPLTSFRSSSSAAPWARVGHRSCRRIEVGWKNVGSGSQSDCPGSRRHTTGRPPRTRHPVHDEDGMIRPSSGALEGAGSPHVRHQQVETQCGQGVMRPPSRSYGVHQPAVPKHCGVLRGAASGDFTHKR